MSGVADEAVVALILSCREAGCPDAARESKRARAILEALRARGFLLLPNAATGAMVSAGADELQPYDVTPAEYGQACEQACDVWDAMWHAVAAAFVGARP
jgi:hypothetical protein